MSNVIQLRPNTDISAALRAIADDIDTMEGKPTDCTIIIGSEVFHLGTVDDIQAAQSAVFNMTYGIHKMMSATTPYED